MRGLLWGGSVLAVLGVAATAAAAPTTMTHGAAGERALLRQETRLLGADHAREHARARAERRRRPALRHRTHRSRTRRALAVGTPAAVGRWSAPRSIPIVGIHATLLHTGKVLFFSYATPTSTVNKGRAYLYDPVTGSGRVVNPPGEVNIWCAGQTIIGDGRVVVAGGNLAYPTSTTNYKGHKTLFTFDPASETWTRQPDMLRGRWYPSLTQLTDDRVVIMGGTDETGTKVVNTDIELFTPSAGATGVGALRKTGTHPLSWVYTNTVLMPNGKVLKAGPGIQDSSFLDPATFTFSDAPDLKVQRYGQASMTLMPGGTSGSTRVLMIGGRTSSGSQMTHASTEQLDVANLGAGWVNRAPMPEPRHNHNTVTLPDGTLLVVGGNRAITNYTEPLTEALMYDPAANAWARMASQTEPRAYHSTALLLPDGRVLSSGDDSYGGGTNDTVEIFEPPYLHRGARPVIGSAPAQVRWGQQFTVGTADAVTRAVLVAPGATTHANDMHQRSVQLALTPTAGGVSLTAPATAAIAPPGHYMLFLLNADGVPSVARFVQLGATAADQPPAAAFEFSPLKPAPGDLVSFASRSTDPEGAPLTHSWDLDGDGVYGDATLPDPSRTYETAGVYRVGLRVTDPGGNTSAATAEVAVAQAEPNQPPTAAFTVPPGVRAGVPVTLTSTSTDPEGDALTYSWDLDGDGAYGDATGASPTHTFATAGTHTVGLRVSDPGATSETTQEVVVGEAPANQPPVAAFSVSPTSPRAGEAVTFTNGSTDPEGAALTYSWDLDGDGVLGDSAAASPTRTYPAAGTYRVTLRVGDGTSTAEASRDVVVAEAPAGETVPPGNLTVNPSFETDVAGWKGYQATVTRAVLAGAPHGAAVARVAWTTGTSYTLDDSVAPIASAPSGAVYRATAWVRAASTSATGKTGFLTIREKRTNGAIVNHVASAPLGTAFAKLTVTSAPVAAGSQVDVYVGQKTSAAGDAFHADLVTLVRP